MPKCALILFLLVLIAVITVGCGKADIHTNETTESVTEDTLSSTTDTVIGTELSELPVTTTLPATEATKQSVTEPTSCVHNYIVSKTVQSSCISAGYTEYYCAKCNDSYVEQTAYATGHSYTTYVVAPTNDSEGYTVYTCIVCGDSYSADYVPKLERMNWTEDMVIQLCNDVRIYAENKGCVIYEPCGSWDGYLSLTTNWDYSSAYAYLTNSVDQVLQKGYCAVEVTYKDANACWRVYVEYNRNYQPE